MNVECSFESLDSLGGFRRLAIEVGWCPVSFFALLFLFSNSRR
jgi:hypothetical protein